MGWYNSSWKFRQKITVPSGKVGSNLTDYPVFVKLNGLPQDFWLNVKNGGGDIRVTSSDGTTELPREVVSCNTSTKAGELHFKATGTLNSGSDNVFYIYYGNSSASDHSVSGTYGRNNVWTADFEIVAHFEEDPDTQSFVNSVGTATGTYTNTNGLITNTGKIGNSCDFSGGNAGNVAISSFTESDRNYAFSAFAKMSSNSSAMAFFEYSTTGSTLGGRRVAARYNSSKLNWNHNNADGYLEPSVTINTGTWYHMSVNASQVDSTHASVKVWIDGANPASHSNYHSIDTNSSNCVIGANRNAGEEWDGAVDELRYYKAFKSDDWMLAESSNLRNPDSFYSIGITEHEAEASNWLDNDWSSRIRIPIAKTNIAENLTNFPIYLDLSELPAGFFTSVKSDGSDIRATLGDGLTQIPCEIVAISTGGETGEVHVKHPLLKPSGGDSIYLYFGNSGASLPSASSTYGSQNVWTNYTAVFHMKQDPSGSAPQMLDSCSGGYNMTASGSLTSGDLVDAKIGKGIDFDYGQSDKLLNSSMSPALNQGSMTFWCKLKSSGAAREGIAYVGDHANSTSYRAVKYDGLIFIQHGTSGPGLSTTVPSLDTWFYYAGRYNKLATPNFLLTLNTSQYTGNGTIGSSINNGVSCGSNANWNGHCVIDEFRYSPLLLSNNYLLAEYNNQNSPSTFYGTIGSVETSNLPPTISSLTPADGATNVSIGANLVIQFNETVVAGSGNILIKKTSDNTTVATIPVGDAQVSISGDTVTINPTSNLAYSTGYYIQIANTCIEDSNGLAFAGISDTTTWNFTTEDPDITAPTLSSSTPADNATGVSASANIVLNFNENVVKGTGNITIKKYDDDTTIETIDVTSGIVSISSAQVTINPASNLPNGTHVYVLIANTCFKDASDNYYAGIASKTVLDFTVADTVAPTLVSTNPVAGATAIVPDTTITLTFDENVVKGTGNITIKKYDDDTTFETIDVTSGQVVVTSNVAVITPGSDLDPNTKYYVLVANTCFKDASNNAYAGLSDNDDLSFTTIPVASETLTPASGATDIAVDTDIEIDFNQDVTVGTGNITINQKPNLKIGGDDFAGDIGEILVIRENLSDEDRQRIEGYLAWRWFSSANPLVSGHPYKYRGPTI